MSRSRSILNVLLLFVFFTSTAAWAGPLFIRVEDQSGQGMGRLRGDECMVIVPAHLIPESARLGNRATEIVVVGPNGAQGNAVFSATVGVPDDDTAMLRVTENSTYVCDDSEAAEIKNKNAATLVMRRSQGDLTYLPVQILEKFENLIIIDSEPPFTISQGMSGASLVENGKLQGFLLSASTTESTAQAISAEYIAGLIGNWVLGGAADLPELQASLSIIETAISMRPTGDIGQIEAVESIIRSGSALEGVDLAGFHLANANLRDARLTGAKMMGVNLENALLDNARLDDVPMSFGKLSSAKGKNLNVEGSSFYFVEADRINVSGVKGQRSNWFGASLQKANFSGADLRNSSFAFADLRGADFSGADLSHALLIGAQLDGAIFEGATLKNNDFLGAHGQPKNLSPSQRREMCARPLRKGYIGLAQRIQLFVDNDDFHYQELIAFKGDGSKACSLMEAYPRGHDMVWRNDGVERYSEQLRLFYDSQLVGKGARMQKFSARVDDHAELLAALRKGKKPIF